MSNLIANGAEIAINRNVFGWKNLKIYLKGYVNLRLSKYNKK